MQPSPLKDDRPYKWCVWVSRPDSDWPNDADSYLFPAKIIAQGPPRNLEVMYNIYHRSNSNLIF